MIRRTTPAVSFTPSHRALMIRNSRALLSGDMSSKQRLRAAWNEIPFAICTMSNKQKFEWHWRIRFDLGLRDNKTFSKSRLYVHYAFAVASAVLAWRVLRYGMFYFQYYQTWPEHMKRENATEYVKNTWGKEVWCADGKFVTPYFHINPPMLTMTMDEL